MTVVPVVDKCAEQVNNPARAAAMVRALTYLIALGVLAGFAWAYREAFYGGMGFPHDTFLFFPADRFTDLTSFYPVLRANDPYSSIATYPPFAFLVMEPFSWVTGDQAMGLWTVIAVGGLGAYVAWELDFVPPIDRAAAVIVLTVVTYPFLFAFDRGNIEVFVTLLLAAFVWALQTGRSDLAAVAIGAAAAMKGYPLIFAALFLVWRQWRPLLITAATAIGLTLVSAIYFYGLHFHRPLGLFRAGNGAYRDLYVIGDAGLGWGCSLFGPLKLLVVDVLGGNAETVRSLLPVYTAFTAILTVGLIVALWRLPLHFWEQITLLVLALNLFPFVSADYKLLHLVVPIALFLRYGTNDPWRWWYLVAFAALMVPKAYILLRPDGTNLGVLLDPLIMLAIGIAIVVAGYLRTSSGGSSGDWTSPNVQLR